LLAILGTLLLALIALALRENHTQNQNLQRYPQPGQLISVGTQQSHIRCEGSGKLTIILEAGAGGTSLDWSSVFEPLAKSYRVCAYDRAGLGWSSSGANPRHTGQITQELHELLLRSGETGPFILVGHSFGGLAARHFARRYSDSVVGLVLVDSPHEDYLRNLTQAQQAARTTQLRSLRVASYLARLGIVRLLGLVSLPPGMPIEVAAAAKAKAARARSINTIYQEAIAFEQSVELLNREPPLSSELPIVVVSRQIDSTAADQAAEASWSTQQTKLVKLTHQTKQVMAASPDHYIQFAQPELLIRVIDELAASLPH